MALHMALVGVDVIPARTGEDPEQLYEFEGEVGVLADEVDEDAIAPAEVAPTNEDALAPAEVAPTAEDAIAPAAGVPTEGAAPAPDNA